MNKLFSLLVLLSVFCLTGCLDYESRVQVKPDGSGYLVETLKFDNTTMNFLKNMASEMTDEEQTEESAPEPVFKEQELRENSSNYGEGVKYVSGHAIKEGDNDGYTATYSFPDVTKLNIGKKSFTTALSENENDDSSDEPGPGEAFDKLTFTFNKANPAVLTVSLLDEKAVKELTSTEPEHKNVEQDSMAAEMALAMMKPFVKGLRIRFIIEPLGTIVGTNSAHLDGSRITLLDMDFETMLQNAKSMHMPIDMNNRLRSLEELNTFLSQTPGVKGQVGDIWVKFE